MPRKIPVPKSDDRHLADLILQIGRAAYADCAAGGLTQAQWMALRFFERANRFSRNISGFAEFHATTKGTASQTVKSLVEQGYVVRTRSDQDARRVRLDLTTRGRDLLTNDPLEHLVRAAGELTSAHRADTVSALRTLVNTLARNRSRSMAGVCARCEHLDGGDQEGFRCRLLQESLDDTELDELCVRFQPAA